MKYLKGLEIIKTLEEGKKVIGTNQFKNVELRFEKRENKYVTYANGLARPIYLHELYILDEWILKEEYGGQDILLYLLNNPSSVLRVSNRNEYVSLKSNKLIYIRLPIDELSSKGKYWITNTEEQNRILDTICYPVDFKLCDLDLTII